MEILPEESLDSFIKNYLNFWKDSCRALIEQSTFTLEDQKYVAMLELEKQITDGRFPKGGGRYTHILVDEFQDINPLDLSLIKAMTTLSDAHLTIVGDDDQAIYEWRGASPNFILDPNKFFERSFDTHILEQNYRCPKNIVSSSQKLIKKNKSRVDKNVIPKNIQDARISIVEEESFSESIDSVMDEVKRFLESSTKSPQSKLAIVSRKKAQLIPYQILMAEAEISFCAAEDLQVFLSDAFEKLLNILNICAKSKDSGRITTVVDDIQSLCDLVTKYPLSKKERNSLSSYLRASRPKTYKDSISSLREYRSCLKGSNDDGVRSHNFADKIEGFLNAESVSSAISEISKNFVGLMKDYGKSSEDIFYSDPPFLYLAEFSKRYENEFNDFIDVIEIAKDTLAQLPDESDQTSQSDWSQPIHLMTALRAKGKEFDKVIILDANYGIWPSKKAETPAQIEQERRLFYVAMTRAKKELTFTLSHTIGDTSALPSPFLIETDLYSI